jgi:hypothetical protein
MNFNFFIVILIKMKIQKISLNIVLELQNYETHKLFDKLINIKIMF